MPAGGSRLREEQIEAEPPGQELGDELPFYAVPGFVERRGEGVPAVNAKRIMSPLPKRYWTFARRIRSITPGALCTLTTRPRGVPREDL
jgi:hypothetical protein